jgi:hypothetical protein
MVAPNDPIAAAAAAAVSIAFASSTSEAPAAEAAGLAGEPRKVSRRKRRANRRNAKQSTGPRTPQGKVRASRNSTTHGIFCRDLVMLGEDEHFFHMTRQSFLSALKPQDAVQLAMVDGAVSARWRLNRCQRAEADLIAQRTARAVKRVEQRVETLKRNIGCDDFSAAAVAAQCERSEVYRRYFQEWKDLNAALRASRHPGHAIAALVQETSDQPLERLSRYEQRLEGSFHRCLRDLHVLKKLAKAYADEPDSPFLGRTVAVDDDGSGNGAGDGAAGDRDGAGAGNGESATPSPRVFVRGEGGGEGQAARGVAERSHADAVSEVERILTPRAPRPSPRSTGERESEPAHANVQNEPTAENSAASLDPADASDDRAGAAPDPAEMEELRKLTDRLSRCRDHAARDDDEDAYDPDDVT